MTEREEVFQKAAAAASILKETFASQGEKLYATEILSQFEFTAGVPNPAWLDEYLQPLIDALAPASFTLTLTASVEDIQGQFSLAKDAAYFLDSEAIKAEDSELAPEVFELYQVFKEACEDKKDWKISSLLRLFRELAACGAAPSLQLQVFLDKNLINQRLVGNGARSTVVSYLFPEALTSMLEKISLEKLEKDIFQEGKRTVIAVFDHSGYQESSWLAVCGHKHAAELDRLIAEPLSPDLLRKNSRILDLRQSQGNWPFPTVWVTPDTFDFHTEHEGEAEISERLSLQWKSMRALLSALFLADRVTTEVGHYRVEYKGYGRLQIPISRAELLEHKETIEPIFGLYSYAYEGLSADKVEIVQQFVSILAADLSTLLSKALEVRDAAKTTYDRALAEQVEDYFEARHKIQEGIKTAVTETTTTVIGLSREVSEDLYKIAGVITLAVVGTLLKPEIGLWAGFGAALVIFAYLCLVLYFHLRTLKDTYRLSMRQHEEYINSYQDILSETEKNALQGEQHLAEAERLFDQRYHWAERLYEISLVIAMLVGVIIVAVMVSTQPAPTPPNPF